MKFGALEPERWIKGKKIRGEDRAECAALSLDVNEQSTAKQSKNLYEEGD